VFENQLKETLRAIFQFKKVTYDLPSEEMPEQECLFINIDRSRNTIKDGRQFAMVTGSMAVWANRDKLPFGFFSKKIQEADISLTKDLYFYELEDNTRTILNICERRGSFTYFFNSQYNPDLGTIESVDIDITTEGDE